MKRFDTEQIYVEVARTSITQIRVRGPSVPVETRKFEVYWKPHPRHVCGPRRRRRRPRRNRARSSLRRTCLGLTRLAAATNHRSMADRWSSNQSSRIRRPLLLRLWELLREVEEIRRRAVVHTFSIQPRCFWKSFLGNWNWKSHYYTKTLTAWYVTWHQLIINRVWC